MLLIGDAEIYESWKARDLETKELAKLGMDVKVDIDAKDDGMQEKGT